MRWFSINITVEVEQKNPEESLLFKDTNASIVSNGIYHRIIYQENKKVDVVLDITKHEMSLKRQGEWLTHGLFSSDNESFLVVKNELGTLKFEVKIKQFIYEEDSLFIEYHLLEENSKISTHQYKIKWNRREELCQQDH